MAAISVVIPCFNAQEYIIKCLDSLQKQTFKDFDVIVIDDCSNDNTYSIVKKYSNDCLLNLSLIRNDNNLGPSVSRRKAIEISDSKYISFCDADDWYSPDYLSCMYQETNYEQNDIVIANYNVLLPNGKIIYKESFPSKSAFSKASLVAQGVDGLWVLLVKRDILMSVDFPDLRNGEDMAIIPIVTSISNTFGFVDKPLYNYCVRSNSLSMKYSEKMMNSLELSFDYIEQHLKVTFPIECEFLGIRNYLYGSLLNLCKHEYSKSKSIKIIDRFNKLYPNWWKNKYILFLPTYKRVFLFFVHCKAIMLCRIIALIHKALSK